ncbi:hypothetical protein [Okeania sp. SIO1I7]|uniref:hypothetical protein n=1 Tax=Okeania sp. SIO1I7 TaxID=2607772 RepID=UPI0013FA0C13|nr:hypothetical protein [Okeania sp. SIO1I7]NET27392.1 hypothetical protein [Okeania sp. SIO1I7]
MILLQLPQLKFQLQPGSTLLLRISFHNWMKEAILLRPTLDDWVVDDDLVVSGSQSLDPPYIYLFSGSDASQMMTSSLPGDVLPGQRLKTWLRFPGIQEEAIPIDIEIMPVVQPHPQVVEFPLTVTFPVSGKTNSGFSHTLDTTMAGILGLISGVIDLDKIPTRWLVAELLIVIAQKGEEYAQTLPGSRLLEQLKHTVFYQNGIVALTSAQLPGWISESLTIANTILGGSSQTPGTQRLLYIWEQWLLSLVETDVEAEEVGKQIFVPPFLAEAMVAKLGMDADRWWGNILLGLSVLSPRVGQILATIAELVTPIAIADAKAAEAGYVLATALPGLNFLPVRWLVVELLVILAQVGNEYAGSAAGKQLSDRLSRTRFFKNGVVALASAKVLRWLQISQSSATAFANSIGATTGMGGMFTFWELWLWSLLPYNSNIQSSVPNNSAREALSAELGINGDLWFEAIILGLAVMSPRIAAILEAIATLAPEPITRPPKPQTAVEDIIGESKSIQL